VIHEIASLRLYYLTHMSPKLVDPWEQTMLRQARRHGSSEQSLSRQ